MAWLSTVSYTHLDVYKRQGKNRELLLRKRNSLLKKLKVLGKLSKEDCRLAELEPLPGAPLPLPQDAPHLLQLFKKQKVQKDTRLLSTLDGNLQANITGILNRHNAVSYTHLDVYKRQVLYQPHLSCAFYHPLPAFSNRYNL